MGTPDDDKKTDISPPLPATENATRTLFKARNFVDLRAEYQEIIDKNEKDAKKKLSTFFADEITNIKNDNSLITDGKISHLHNLLEIAKHDSPLRKESSPFRMGYGDTLTFSSVVKNIQTTLMAILEDAKKEKQDVIELSLKHANEILTTRVERYNIGYKSTPPIIDELKQQQQQFNSHLSTKTQEKDITNKNQGGRSLSYADRIKAMPSEKKVYKKIAPYREKQETILNPNDLIRLKTILKDAIKEASREFNEYYRSEEGKEDDMQIMEEARNQFRENIDEARDLIELTKIKDKIKKEDDRSGVYISMSGLAKFLENLSELRNSNNTDSELKPTNNKRKKVMFTIDQPQNKTKQPDEIHFTDLKSRLIKIIKTHDTSTINPAFFSNKENDLNSLLGKIQSSENTKSLYSLLKNEDTSNYNDTTKIRIDHCIRILEAHDPKLEDSMVNDTSSHIKPSK